MPRTFTGFPPLGLVLLIMLGAGVAEQSGLLSALIRKAVRHVPERLLAPAVILLGMLTVHAIDAGYFVYIPLAGVVFANAGRNPVLGIVLGFVGCGTGLAGNLLPGQYDVLILGITQVGATLLEPGWTMNPLGNWWFMIAIAVAFVGLGWLIAARMVGPRLEAWDRRAGHGTRRAQPRCSTPSARACARRAGPRLRWSLAVAALVFIPGYSPLYDPAAAHRPSGPAVLPLDCRAAVRADARLRVGLRQGRRNGQRPSRYRRLHGARASRACCRIW